MFVAYKQLTRLNGDFGNYAFSDKGSGLYSIIIQVIHIRLIFKHHGHGFFDGSTHRIERQSGIHLRGLLRFVSQALPNDLHAGAIDGLIAAEGTTEVMQVNIHQSPRKL
ncbi:hypothetical protein LXM25_05835 [Dyadobacter sp. LJ53]|nr:hypothetical protein [Dyadobacter chenwenxiniae]MCF0049564.1 hypothetical protein [Dyadobacter chenwenxiniae]